MYVRRGFTETAAASFNIVFFLLVTHPTLSSLHPHRRTFQLVRISQTPSKIQRFIVNSVMDSNTKGIDVDSLTEHQVAQSPSYIYKSLAVSRICGDVRWFDWDHRRLKVYISLPEIHLCGLAFWTSYLDGGMEPLGAVRNSNNMTSINESCPGYGRIMNKELKSNEPSRPIYE